MEALHRPTEILTLRDVAVELRCSKAHVCNLVNGRVTGVPPLPHISLGRRKLIRREWLDQWLEDAKTLIPG